MKKIVGFFILVLIFFSNCLFAVAEKLPSYESDFRFNQENNPIWYKYLNDYKDQLYNAFDTKKFRGKEWGCSYVYTIYRDGSISDIHYRALYKEKDIAYIEQIIIDNPPPPFPKEIEEDSIKIETSIWKANYDEQKVGHFAYKNEARITIYKSYKNKKK